MIFNKYIKFLACATSYKNKHMGYSFYGIFKPLPCLPSCHVRVEIQIKGLYVSH